ncbi:phage tail sheath protein [Roseibium sp. TrichSKD4]|uniref:phage tail sheath subtilisin-like domain-containing protein n=1 Tax=Roseibium sp. TrichSKD4 TaxID=744980 RepID=UPI0001E56D58|nr:phage tail sheath subtilisin-like domain-containing protein [Roseibium sp. TrichSKD4]EFO32137.1 phage tail sheath protein [Roseibium sp. TrichSKD4]
MTDIYLHGIETIETNVGPRSVVKIDTGIIGLIGTSPDADAGLWPYNTPIAVHGHNDFPTGLGAEGTLRDALIGIFKQATRASQTIVVVRVEEGGTVAETMTKIIGDPGAKTGMYAFLRSFDMLELKPKLLVAPGYTSQIPAGGISEIQINALGSGYTSAPTVTINGDGSGATATATIADGKLQDITVTNGGSNYSEATVEISGGGGTDGTANAVLEKLNNPVTAGLLTIANRLRAGVIVDGPNTTNEAAVAYRMGFDTNRPMLIVDPFPKVFDDGEAVIRPASPMIAGLQARIDYDEGFWVSPSNHVIEGVIGTARSVGHSISDPSAESQYLNKNEVATIVRSPSGGFKLWGSRNPSSDSLNAFWSVRRAHDAVIESIEIAHEPFIDKPFSLQTLLDIAETTNSALRRWQALGAILGGRVWLDPTKNTKETWQQGQLYVSYDAEAPSPIEQITFMFNRNTGYYERVFDNVAREIQRISAAAI